MHQAHVWGFLWGSREVFTARPRDPTKINIGICTGRKLRMAHAFHKRSRGVSQMTPMLAQALHRRSGDVQRHRDMKDHDFVQSGRCITCEQVRTILTERHGFLGYSLHGASSMLAGTIYPNLVTTLEGRVVARTENDNSFG